MVWTVAHDYAKNGRLKELEEYLRRYPNHANEKDHTGVTILLLILSLLLYFPNTNYYHP